LLKINPNLPLGTRDQGLGTGERSPSVSACGAVYPVIPLAKAEERKKNEKGRGKKVRS